MIGLWENTKPQKEDQTMIGFNRTLKTAILLALGILVFSVSSQAGRMGPGGGYHMMGSGMMSQLTTEEQQTVNELMQKYHAPMMELKKQIFAKRAELNAVLAQDPFDAKKARALSKEIAALKSRFTEQHMEMFIEMRNKGVSYYGTCMSGGRMGRGMMMDGGMMGPGRMMDYDTMGPGMMDGDMMNQNMMKPMEK
jgi:zinc resistance-associated protein